jgi:ferredoxin-like protein FixX
MNIRTILILAALAGAGAYVYVDYNSAESKLAREMKEIEQLSPDTRAPECFGKGTNAKLFAIAVERDRHTNAEVDNDTVRKNVIKHDCIRGGNTATIQRVVKALGPAGVPVYSQVLQSCPVSKDEYPVYACFALDALKADGSKAAVATLEKELTNKDKSRRNIYEGALYRLMNTEGWATTAQLADRVPTESEWEAKELIMEHVRNHRDPAAKPNLQRAYAAETDQQERGLIKAAILEIDNPGKCVVTDEGRAENGLCRYACHDQNKWFNFPKPKTGCPLVQDVPADKAAAQTPPVNAASPVSAK